MQKQPKQRSHQQKQYVYHVSRRSSDDQPLDELLEQFWKIEAEGTQPEPESKNPVDKEALDILNKTISYNGERYEYLHKGGFRLTKFVSNKHEALMFIEQEDRDELKEINRVLGQKWDTRTDCFLMKTLEHFPRNASEYTQRKMFSLVSTIFDPLGILVPAHN